MKRIPLGISFVIVIAAALAASCTQDRDSAKSAAAATPPKSRFETLVIPDGTDVVATLDSRLSTETSHTGDRFVVTTITPIMVNGRTAVPTGARIHGVLHDVQASGRTSGRARMTLAYHELVDSQGKTYAISAVPLTIEAASATHGDVEKIAAGGILGAIIGGIAGGGKGAAIGAGAGAGAGTVLMLATKGDDMALEAGQRLNVHLTIPTTVQVLAQR